MPLTADMRILDKENAVYRMYGFSHRIVAVERSMPKEEHISLW